MLSVLRAAAEPERVGSKWVPAFAGMTDVGAGMTDEVREYGYRTAADGYETVRVFFRRKSISMNCPSVIVFVK